MEEIGNEDLRFGIQTKKNIVTGKSKGCEYNYDGTQTKVLYLKSLMMK